MQEISPYFGGTDLIRLIFYARKNNLCDSAAELALLGPDRARLFSTVVKGINVFEFKEQYYFSSIDMKQFAKKDTPNLC